MVIRSLTSTIAPTSRPVARAAAAIESQPADTVSLSAAPAPRPQGVMQAAAGAVGGPAGHILVMVPDDFMWPEFDLPVRQYREAGYEVTIATKNGQAANPDHRNYGRFDGVRPLEADVSFAEVDVSKFDAVTTVGGNGAWHDFFPDANAHRVLSESLQSGKVTGLICASTGTLAMINNFEGDTPIAADRKVTGYFKVEGLLRNVGQVDFVDGAPDEVTVVQDGNLITGRNPESSELFGQRVLEALSQTTGS